MQDGSGRLKDSCVCDLCKGVSKANNIIDGLKRVLDHVRERDQTNTVSGESINADEGHHETIDRDFKRSEMFIEGWCMGAEHTWPMHVKDGVKTDDDWATEH